MEKPCTTCEYCEKQYIRKPRPDKYPYELHDVYAGLICTKYNGPFGKDCRIYQNWRIVQKARRLAKKENGKQD